MITTAAVPQGIAAVFTKAGQEDVEENLAEGGSYSGSRLLTVMVSPNSFAQTAADRFE